MLNTDKLLRRQCILFPRSKPKLSGFYRHTIISPATCKPDIQHVFEYSYACIGRYTIVRITL